MAWAGQARSPSSLGFWASQLGTPKPVVKSLLDRLAKGKSGTFIIKSGTFIIRVVDLNMGQFQVQKSDDTLRNLLRYYIRMPSFPHKDNGSTT